MAGNFAPSFSLKFLSILAHISGSIEPITLIWDSLERSFPPAEVVYRSWQFWSQVMMSEMEQRSGLIMGSYRQHKSQWFKHWHGMQSCWAQNKVNKILLHWEIRTNTQFKQTLNHNIPLCCYSKWWRTYRCPTHNQDPQSFPTNQVQGFPISNIDSKII